MKILSADSVFCAVCSMPASPKMHSNVKTFKHVAGNRLVFNQTNKEMIMWTKPEVTEMRFGFEVTMYVCNR